MTPHCGMTSEVALLKEGGNCTHHYRCGSKYLRRTTSKLVFLLRRTHVPKSRSQRVTGEARKNTRNILKHPSVISQPGNEREGHMVRYHAWTPSCTVPAITIADIWLKNMTRGGIFI